MNHVCLHIDVYTGLKTVYCNHCVMLAPVYGRLKLLLMNGSPKPSGKSAWEEEKFANIYSCRLHNYDDFVDIYATERLFCLRFELTDSLFASEEQKKVGSWCHWHFCCTCWPCSWHRRYRLPGTKWQCSWPFSWISNIMIITDNLYVVLFFDVHKLIALCKKRNRPQIRHITAVSLLFHSYW